MSLSVFQQKLLEHATWNRLTDREKLQLIRDCIVDSLLDAHFPPVIGGAELQEKVVEYDSHL